jgi:hypothetical protein
VIDLTEGFWYVLAMQQMYLSYFFRKAWTCFGGGLWNWHLFCFFLNTNPIWSGYGFYMKSVVNRRHIRKDYNKWFFCGFLMEKFEKISGRGPFNLPNNEYVKIRNIPVIDNII